MLDFIIILCSRIIPEPRLSQLTCIVSFISPYIHPFISFPRTRGAHSYANHVVLRQLEIFILYRSVFNTAPSSDLTCFSKLSGCSSSQSCQGCFSVAAQDKAVSDMFDRANTPRLRLIILLSSSWDGKYPIRKYRRTSGLCCLLTFVLDLSIRCHLSFPTFRWLSSSPISSTSRPYIVSICIWKSSSIGKSISRATSVQDEQLSTSRLLCLRSVRVHSTLFWMSWIVWQLERSYRSSSMIRRSQVPPVWKSVFIIPLLWREIHCSECLRSSCYSTDSVVYTYKNSIGVLCKCLDFN